MHFRQLSGWSARACLSQLVFYMLRLGTLGFGGPVALAAQLGIYLGFVH
ncbi:hypothetical protein ACI48D_21345 [Massilia sp. LXY-6]